MPGRLNPGELAEDAKSPRRGDPPHGGNVEAQEADRVGENEPCCLRWRGEELAHGDRHRAGSMQIPQAIVDLRWNRVLKEIGTKLRY